MSKQWWINLGLLAVVLALAALVVYEPGLEKAPPPLPQLSAMPLESISRLHIERSGKPTVLLEKDADHWYLRQPLQLPANDTKIERLLKGLHAASYAQFPAEADKLAEFGLNPPQLTLIAEDTVFAFGSTSPLESKRYVRLNDAVHVTDDNLYYQLEVEPASLAHLTPLGIGARIADLQTPYFHIRRDNDQWLVEGTEVQASVEQLQHTVDAWQKAQAFNVRPYESGDNQGEVIIRLQDRDDHMRLEIRTLAPELVLANAAAGVIYELSSRQVKDLMQLGDTPPAPAGAHVDKTEN